MTFTPRKRRFARDQRRGSIATLSAVFLVTLFAFVAFAVDTGKMVMTQTHLQNACDAAALAASQEINAAVEQAGEDQSDVDVDANSIAVAQARLMAVEVAALNGVHVDPDSGVEFGRRNYDAASDTWAIAWNQGPYNVVRVTARRDNTDVEQPDGRLQLTFGWAVGKSEIDLVTSATAFVESRDLVVVLDFSASMNNDSEMWASGHLGQSAVEQNQDDMWDTLVASGVTWPGTNEVKFPATGFGNLDSYYGTYDSSWSNYDVFYHLGLDATDSNGDPLYPFPQAGKTNGVPNARPDYWTSRSLWLSYIQHAKYISGTYKMRYGYRSLMDHLLHDRKQNYYSEDLWRTPHYPFHAVKNGTSLLLNFLSDLDFGDEVGMVSYDSYSRVETFLDYDGVYVNLSDDPITSNYAGLDAIQRHKQAGHYYSYTGIGYGLEDAHELLDNHARFGSRPTILLMTDGNANRYPSGWSLPSGWSWDTLTDYDGDGDADYTTSTKAKQYAFYEAVRAIDSGFTIHTMSVGTGADRELMKAIAYAGSGLWIDIPGGSSVAEMEGQLLSAFSNIAANVPPPRLIHTGNDD